MSTPHIKSLINRRARLQRDIEREQAAAQPDTLRLMQLKRLRLMLKDRIAHLARYIDGPRLAPVAALRRRRRARSR
jgi:hypothetical protein